MKTLLDEIADGVFQVQTFLPEAYQRGFTINVFLIRAEEPMLFHCGPAAMFENVAEFVGRVIKLHRIKFIGFSHLESDECGALDQWLDRCRQAEVVMGRISARSTATGLTTRPIRVLDDGAPLDLGDKTLRYKATPHLLHGWDAGMLFDETTNSLFCADLMTQLGERPAVTKAASIVDWALEADAFLQATALTPTLPATLRQLADLGPETLAIMHGASFEGDCRDALHALADGYERRVEERMP